MDKISFYCLAAVVALLPIFVLPFYQPDAAKFLLLALGTGLSFVFWAVARLMDGRPRSPRAWTFIGLKLLVIVVLAAALASPAARVSLIGQGSETDTFAAVLVFTLAAGLACLHFNKKNLLRLYKWLFGSFLLAALFELAILLLGKFPWFAGSFVKFLPPNLEGTLNSFALLCGLMIVLALAALSELHLRLRTKFLLWLTIALGLLFLAVANFPLGWLLTAIFALIVFVREIVFQEEVFKSQSAGEPDLKFIRQPRRFPTASFVILLICLFFLLGNGLIGASVPDFFGVSNTEVRPSFSLTWQVAQTALQDRWLLGAGSNQFGEIWLLHHPASLNATALWDAIFPTGFSWVFTLLISTGALGALALLIFLFFCGRDIWRSFKLQAAGDHLSNYLLLSSMLAALYLWLALFLYVPTLLIVALAFFFIGLWAAVLRENGGLREFSVEIGKRRWLMAIFTLILTAALIGALYGGFSVTRRFAAVTHYIAGARALSAGGLLDKSEAHFIKAARLGQNDVYLRALSGLYLRRLESLLKNPESVTGGEEAFKETLRQTAARAEQAALQATAAGRTYLNFMNQGLVYEALLSLGVEGAYQAAQEAYGNARALNPANPLPLLARARAEAAVNNIPAAKALAEEALKLKPDFEEALTLLDSLKTPPPSVLTEGEDGQALPDNTQ